MLFRPGNADVDTSSSHGSDDFPPPPPPPASHAPALTSSSSVKHDVKPVSFSAPTPWKSPAVSAVSSAPKAPAAGGLTPTQQALLEAEEEGDTPKHRSSSQIQSRSFKMLQQQINDGSGDLLLAGAVFRLEQRESLQYNFLS